MGILGTDTTGMKHIAQVLVLAHGFGENGGAGSLIYECDLNPLDCGLKIEFDLGDDDEPTTGVLTSNPTELLDQANQELQGLGENGNCGFIYLCDLDPLDCSLKIECDLGDDTDDGLVEENQIALEQASQLQGGDASASLVH